MSRLSANDTLHSDFFLQRRSEWYSPTAGLLESILHGTGFSDLTGDDGIKNIRGQVALLNHQRHGAYKLHARQKDQSCVQGTET